MNFVETGKPVFFTQTATAPVSDVAATESVKAESTPTTSNTKAFFTSMVLAMVIFSFTLSGMMSACNWIVDEFVIPRVMAKTAELSKPLLSESDLTALDSSASNAAASVR